MLVCKIHSTLAPLSMEFPRKEYWSELPFPSSGDLVHPGIKPSTPAWQADSLLSEPSGKRVRIYCKISTLWNIFYIVTHDPK